MTTVDTFGPNAAIGQLAGTGLLGVISALLIYTVIKLYGELRDERAKAVVKAEECGRAISAKDKEIQEESRARIADALEGKRVALEATREQWVAMQAMERLTDVILERDRLDKERDRERVRAMQEKLKKMAETGPHRALTRSEALALHGGHDPGDPDEG